MALDCFSRMTSSRRQLLYRVGLGFGSLFFVYQIWTGYHAVLGTAFRLSFLTTWLLAWGLIAIALGLQVTAWYYLMQGLGAHLPWRQVVKGYMRTFLPRYIPGSVWGYWSRSEWLRHSYNISYGVSNLGSILEVLVTVMTAGLLVGVYYAFVSTGILQLALWLSLILFPFVSWLTLNWIWRWQIVRRQFKTAFMGSTIPGISLQRWVFVVLLYILLWLCYGGLILLLVQAFDNTAPQREIIQATFIFAAAWLAGFLTVFVPAGLGVREAALSSLILANLGLLPVQAAGISVVSRFVISAAELTWVLVGLVLR